LFLKDKITYKHHIITNAVATQNLEGLHPDPKIIKALYDAAGGLVTIDEIIEDYKNTVKSSTAL